MKKILVSTLLLVISLVSYAAIQSGEAEITFENTSHNFGTFSESSPKVTCTFKFKNTGDGPLVIHQQLHHVDVLFLSIPRNLLNRERVDKSQSFTMVPANFRDTLRNPSLSAVMGKMK